MMVNSLKKNYIFDASLNLWSRPGYVGIAYSDGDVVEQTLASILTNTRDLSVLSNELRKYCTDWPSTYHLSAARANILRPFESQLGGNVLEIGAGCGAITRYLGELGGNVLALEGSQRRASIARSRTRDLGNVNVVAEKFDQLQIDRHFDVVTLIGVLEYAKIFMPGKSPALSMLERARSFLKPSGKLIIAIENQLGLKYFAGAAEDHIGQAMYGIEGKYQNNQAETFGRMVLVDLLTHSGFKQINFLAPFPDYKLPISIISESGFSDKNFDPAALASQCVRSDPQLPPLLAFSPELVWPILAKNDLALDMANSFLIVAENQEDKAKDTSILAWHYSTARQKDYCKETVFRKSKLGYIETYYRRLSPISSRKKINDSLINFSIPEKAKYILGTPLSDELIRIVSRDGWRIKDVGEFIKKYLKILTQISESQGKVLQLNGPDSKVFEEFLDLLPQNIICSGGDQYNFIDREWSYGHSLKVGHLVYRSILGLFNSISKFGQPLDFFEISKMEFIRAVMESIGWPISKNTVLEYAQLEDAIQSTVIGAPQKSAMHLDNRVGVFENFTKITYERGNQMSAMAELHQIAVDRQAEIQRLQNEANLRDTAMAELHQIAVDRQAEIQRLQNEANLRDTAMAELHKKIIEIESTYWWRLRKLFL
jgi:2-polyprenyl-3-methyl-5-hydroxy-6-metoxy-1,4-benzoquinol methylase